MTDLNKFIQSQSDTGVQQSEGVFTMAPELARRKLSESVPENYANGWSALCFLGAALRLSGMVPAPETRVQLGISPIHKLLVFSRDATVQMAVRYSVGKGKDWESLAQDLRENLVEACERPFSGTCPIALCLSRAVLILSKLKLSVSFEFLGSEQADYLLSNDPDFEFMDKSLEQARGKETVGFVALIQATPGWCDALSQDKDDRPDYRIMRLLDRDDPLRISTLLQERAKAKELSLLGLKFQRDSAWTKAPAREILDFGFCVHKGGWFDYRCKEAVLAEVFIATDEVTPLSLDASCATGPSEDSIQRPGQKMNTWERYRSQAEKLILRWWYSPPCLEHDSLHARAIFVVGLSETSSRVAFLNWGQTKDQILLPDCPPGLGGFVYWPGLKQSLYGDSWVQDEAYQQALEWTTEQANKVFATLAREFDYVWEMLERDHVRKSYKPEVERRLRAWLGVGPD